MKGIARMLLEPDDDDDDDDDDDVNPKKVADG